MVVFDVEKLITNTRGNVAVIFLKKSGFQSGDTRKLLLSLSVPVKAVVCAAVIRWRENKIQTRRDMEIIYKVVIVGS